ncbi:CPBP family intramembrane glutamic endopeptidase [Mucilaginibacter flavidus]|uniref:CPBP family intramembrane glutamic endopeptidase n=1 Tax=Mucilaginibacter flavidus TaxID=2949309 RepID=UPI002093F5A0|nr:type II CAAX endopeptidase family protein [Mucilaginibacter flavidus]MCO5945725.1 CPBP family intramembrane metalloprotease [Mucilaginibacter flavidus]
MDAIPLKRSNTILITGIVFAIFYFPAIGQLFYHDGQFTAARIVSSRVVIWGEVLLLYFYAAAIEKNKLLLWADKKYNAGFYFASFGALYLLGIGAGIISKAPALFGYHDDRKLLLRLMGIVATSWPMLILTAVTAGITEELIFRGYLVPRLEVLFKNKYMPVIISSLAFGLIHYRYHSLGEVIFATLFGVVFAIHYQWYRNIKILIITHACVDFVSLCIFKLALHYHLPIK